MVGGWWLVVDGWWLVVDGWWLMVGGWWLVVLPKSLLNPIEFILPNLQLDDDGKN